MQEYSIQIARTEQVRRSASLYVRLIFRTHGDAPLLADEDAAQEASAALTAQVRMQRCHVLAIACDGSALHVILQFPASLSLRHLAECARSSSATALARMLTLEHGGYISADSIWSRDVQMDTLSQADIPLAVSDLRQHVKIASHTLTAEPHVV